MTFPEFQATGRTVEDLSKYTDDVSEDAGIPGRVYAGNLWCEDAGESWRGRWYTHIGNQEYQSDNLTAIELHLYNFAIAEGIA
jgi:hypothetical protein